jgi:hypothetical protein
VSSAPRPTHQIYGAFVPDQIAARSTHSYRQLHDSVTLGGSDDAFMVATSLATMC